MRYEQVSIASVVSVEAPHRVTSAWLEEQLAPTMQRLGIRPNLLESLSGIVARRWWDPETAFSTAATMAAEKAIAAAGIERGQLGVLINTSVCRDYIEPSTACLVHGNLELHPTCMNFDLGNACLAFINGMDVAANMIERGQIDWAIIVDGEGSRFVQETTIQRLLDPATDEAEFRGSFATLTLGSGAAAMVLGRSDLVPGGHRYLGSVSLAATQHRHLCHGQPDRMWTDTKALLMGGLQLAGQTWGRAKEELGWRPECLSQFIIHQVSKVHTEQLAALCRLPLDRIHRIYPEYGNIGPAAVPIVLAQAAEQGKLAAGDRVALMGIGSGLNCTMGEVVW
ncbi:MAG: 3-oxoacyl-ACP synthase III [Pseudomonadota bacterium]